MMSGCAAGGNTRSAAMLARLVCRSCRARRSAAYSPPFFNQADLVLCHVSVSHTQISHKAMPSLLCRASD